MRMVISKGLASSMSFQSWLAVGCPCHVSVNLEIDSTFVCQATYVRLELNVYELSRSCRSVRQQTVAWWSSA